ncbi:hypothetical protein HHK36_001393 [Tetracentron sinense]|uniref:RING-type domain-containing protein n=1 Tax=Tetracentron sinense TaxID=13715 RepID=A0A834ZU04_TETSI|nr:hypothetical protein HHK36_001393 [Tetracentron sinense]
MGTPCVGLKIPKPVTYLLDLLCHIKSMVMLSLLRLHLLHPLDHSEHHPDSVPAWDRPSPLMVPVPVMSGVVLGLIKKKLPVVEFSNFLERSGRKRELENSACAICLNCMEGSHEMRELSNCSHVFHGECLDMWVSKGKVTCPLCRSKLLPAQGEEIKSGGDPWRLERLAYLFGEDYVMDTC